MKRNYLIVFFSLLMLALNVNAQETETYNMIVKLPDGTTITLSTDDVDEVSFNNGNLVISGESLKEILNQYKERYDVVMDAIEKLHTEVNNEQNSVNAIECELADLKEHNNSQRADISALWAYVNGNQELIANNTSEIAAQQSDIELFKMLITEQQDRISANETDIAWLKVLYDELRCKVDESVTKDILYDFNQSQQAQIDALNQTVAAQQAMITLLENEINTIKTTLYNLQQE